MNTYTESIHAMQNTRPLRILIIGENPLARTGLAALLSATPDVAIVGQTSPGGDLGVELDIYRPDLIVWDLGWEVVSGLEKLTELAEPHIPVVALLADEDTAAEVWNAGVNGLLPQRIRAGELMAALRAVGEGLFILHPSLAAAIMPPKKTSIAEPKVALTPREFDVLQQLARGLTNKAIAHDLAISEHTIKFHVNAIMSKLGAQSRTEAVVIATRLGLILL